jgi:hypothetical protein
LSTPKFAIPPFHDLPRYTPAFLKTVTGRPDGSEPPQIELSVAEAMTILEGGCILAEDTSSEIFAYSCWFLTRSGRLIVFVGIGPGHLYLTNAAFAESFLIDFLQKEQLNELRSHGIITSELA